MSRLEAPGFDHPVRVPGKGGLALLDARPGSRIETAVCRPEGGAAPTQGRRLPRAPVPDPAAIQVRPDPAAIGRVIATGHGVAGDPAAFPTTLAARSHGAPAGRAARW